LFASVNCAGTDASTEFDAALHPPAAIEDMKKYAIGLHQTTSNNVVSNSNNVSIAGASTLVANDTNVGVNNRICKFKILYGSQKGCSLSFAQRIETAAKQIKFPSNIILETSIVSMDKIDTEDLNKEEYLIFITSTYTDGTPPDNAKFFCQGLEDAAIDFRVGPAFLANVNTTNIKQSTAILFIYLYIYFLFLFCFCIGSLCSIWLW
jgi:sulfite reductase alpha subunit-like flavoprotein